MVDVGREYALWGITSEGIVLVKRPRSEADVFDMEDGGKGAV